jgi:peptidoglycan-N-acetylglucosamine deacetylase
MMAKMTRPRSGMAITTSWDDGHPLDFRIANLLAKHGIPGTFYLPLKNVRPTVSPSEIRELSLSFEIGAHTVNHVRLSGLPVEEGKL